MLFHWLSTVSPLTNQWEGELSGRHAEAQHTFHEDSHRLHACHVGSTAIFLLGLNGKTENISGGWFQIYGFNMALIWFSMDNNGIIMG